MLNNKMQCETVPRDELWLRKRELAIEKAREEFAEYMRIRKKINYQKILEEHDKINLEIGPHWFQELAVDQLKTVNQLVLDFDANSFRDVKSDLIRLGIDMDNLKTSITLRQCFNYVRKRGGNVVEFILQFFNTNFETDFKIKSNFSFSKA